MALKNVVIGYAKGDKGDKGDTGERGTTGQTGPQGEPGNIADAAITDTQGLDVAKGAKTTAQKLFDAIADRIVNKLVTNDTLTTKLADYLLKSAMSSTNIDSTTNVPTSALVYSLMQDVNNNLSNTNSRLDTSLSSSVLDYALTLPEGLHAVQFPGTGYTGTDLPKSSYMYSSATISVRSTGKIATVLLFGISKSCPLAVNSCEDRKWKGWDQYVTKNDLPQFGLTPGIDCASNTVTEFKVTFPKAFSKAPVVIATPISNTTGINGIPKYAVWNVTTTGFTIRIYNDDSGQRSPAFCWMAMAQS